MITTEQIDDRFYCTHPIFTSTNTIIEFARPLAKINIDYFTFDRHYDDHSRISLTTAGAWIEHYWRDHLYESAIFEKDPLNFANGYVFWDWLKREPVYSAAAQHGIDNGITIIERNKHHSDFFHFGALHNNSITHDYLIKNFEHLYCFIALFKQKMKGLITHAEKNKIHINLVSQNKNIILQSDLNSTLTKEELPEIILKNDITRLYLGDEFKNNYLTRKEVNIIVKLIQGETITEVAHHLSISKSTAEYHIKNIKTKLACKTMFELAYHIGKISTKNIYPFSIK